MFIRAIGSSLKATFVTVTRKMNLEAYHHVYYPQGIYHQPTCYNNYNSESPSSSPTSSDDSRISRPFKALPRNSLELAVDMAKAEIFFTGDNTTSALAYAQFRQQCLSQMKNKADLGLKESMKRIRKAKTDDPDYLKKRKKNNEAAKRSRDARKAKQDEMAIRVTFLEQEALALKMQLAQSLRERDVLLRAYYWS